MAARGRNWLWAPLALALALASGGCLERTNATPPPTLRHADVPVPRWKYVASFGGPAQLTVSSDDPYARRYEDGKFVQLSGISATDHELWACDLGVSRVQVFDFDGRWLRSVGSGVPLEGTLPTDAELYHEQKTLNLQQGTKWEDTPNGQRWVNDKTGLFKASDIVATDKGFWLADQTTTSGYGHSARFANVRFYGDDGSQMELPVENHLVWPAYLAVDRDVLAFSEDPGNVLWMARRDPEQGQWIIKRPNNYTSHFVGVMGVWQNEQFGSSYARDFAHATNASASEEGFDQIGGVAFFDGKLLVCDRQNRRIKVYESRPEYATSQWGKMLKIISGDKPTGGMRFAVPRDVDVSSDGVIYVLDAERREIAILSPNFERVGTIPGDHFDDPRALSLSPDGQHLFVSDPGSGLIHRYDAQ
jgi:hypothetical protein